MYRRGDWILRDDRGGVGVGVGAANLQIAALSDWHFFT